jgi:protein TonB
VTIALTLEAVVLLCFNHPAAGSPPPRAPSVPLPPLPPLEVTPIVVSSPDEPGGRPEVARPTPAVLPEPPPEPSRNRITIDTPSLQHPSLLPSTQIVWEPPVPGPGDHFGPVGSGQLDNAPRVRFQQPPKYPYEAVRAQLHGTVVVEVGVDEGGRVYDPRVVRSSDALFDEPTLEAVRQWRFEPGRRNGRIVRFRMMLPVEFHLDQE